MGGDSDGYQNLWNNYWVKTALLDLHTDPFYTHHLYHPTGTSLRFHTLNPFNGLLTLPLNLVLGYVPGINLLFLASLALTAFFSFLLIYDLTGNAWAAFAGAAVVTFANPRVVLFFNSGQSEKLSAEWLFLYLFFLFRALPHETARRSFDESLPAGHDKRLPWPWYAGAAVLTLLVTSLTDWQYLMYAVLVTLLYFGFTLFTRRTLREKGQIFGRLAAIGGSYALVAGPLLIFPMVREALDSPWLSVSHQSQLHALDLFDILGMGLGNPGYAVLLLALFGLWIAFRRSGHREPALFWALVAAFGYLMALGPTLTVGGEETGIPFPYSLLQDLPVFSVGRDPGRFTTLAVLGIGILAAFGLRALLDRMAALGERRERAARPSEFNMQNSLSMSSSPMSQGRATNRGATHNFQTLPEKLAPPLVTGLFLLVTLWPFAAATGEATSDPPDWPPFYRQLAEDPDRYAILELPPFTEKGRGESYYMMLQSLHGKPRFSGRLARDRKLTNPNNFVKRASLFRHFWLLDYPEERRHFYPERDFLTPTDYAAVGRAILSYYNVRYIVVYEEALGSGWKEEEFQRIISRMLGEGTQPVYADPLMRAYRVPTASPPANPLTLDTGDGWFPSEVGPDGVPFRWADRTVITDKSGYVITPTAQLYTMNLRAEPVRALLSFAAFPYKEARTLKVMLNGEEVASVELRPEEGAKPVSLEVTLPPGNNLIELTSPDFPLPTDNPQADARLLSFGVREVLLEAR